MFHTVYNSFESGPNGRDYIGKHSTDDPYDDYMGSFKDKTFNPDDKIVFAYSKTKEGAVWLEIMFQRVFGVMEDPQFANKSYQTSTGFDRTGAVDSEETRRKKKEAHIGKKRQFSEKHCANISKSKKNNQPGAKAGGLAAGTLNAELGKGFCSTEYRDSEKCGEDRIKASRKGADVSSRPVLITFENGSTNVFSSLSQAGRSTGMTSQSLGALAKSGKVGIKGKYKGVRVEYV